MGFSVGISGSVGVVAGASVGCCGFVGTKVGYLIDTYERLKNYAKNAQSDCLYVLNKDIVQSDNLNDIEIEIPAYSHFILDLKGYSISRTTSGNDAALFRIEMADI